MRLECGDTPGRLLVWSGFSYYFASREEALEGRSMPASAPGGDRVSSAILYAAIIAIWAVVLIPRWLRRDSSVPSSSTAEHARPDGDDGDVEYRAAQQSSPRRGWPASGGGLRGTLIAGIVLPLSTPT